MRHPGDETGLRGILGHLSVDMFRVYTHIAHEIIAQRAGRVSLCETWLGGGDERESDQQVATPAPAHMRISELLTGLDADERRAFFTGLDTNERRALLKALLNGDAA